MHTDFSCHGSYWFTPETIYTMLPYCVLVICPLARILGVQAVEFISVVAMAILMFVRALRMQQVDIIMKIEMIIIVAAVLSLVIGMNKVGLKGLFSHLWSVMEILVCRLWHASLRRI